MSLALLTDGADVAVPLGVAATFVVSGAAKLRDVAATRTALTDLGLPRPFRTAALARALGPAELLLGIAVLVCSGPAASVALASVGVLAVVFTVVVAGVLARRRTVHCNCFGAASTGPLTRWSLVRNVMLVGAVVLALLDPAVARGVPGRLLALDAEGRTWLLAVVLGGVAVVVVQRRHGALAARLADLEALVAGPTAAGPPPVIPDVGVRDLVGIERSLPTLVRERAQLLVFLRPGCDGCAMSARHVPGWSSSLGHAVQVRAVTTATFDAFAAEYRDLCDDALYVTPSVLDALGVRSVPSAVLLGTDGTVAAGPLVGQDAIAELVAGVRDVLSS